MLLVRAVVIPNPSRARLSVADWLLSVQGRHAGIQGCFGGGAGSGVVVAGGTAGAGAVGAAGLTWTRASGVCGIRYILWAGKSSRTL
jgi:hypothetical protein